jgi:hypothetical protein
VCPPSRLHSMPCTNTPLNMKDEIYKEKKKHQIKEEMSIVCFASFEDTFCSYNAYLHQLVVTVPC